MQGAGPAQGGCRLGSGPSTGTVHRGALPLPLPHAGLPGAGSKLVPGESRPGRQHAHGSSHRRGRTGQSRGGAQPPAGACVAAWWRAPRWRVRWCGRPCWRTSCMPSALRRGAGRRRSSGAGRGRRTRPGGHPSPRNRTSAGTSPWRQSRQSRCRSCTHREGVQEHLDERAAGPQLDALWNGGQSAANPCARAGHSTQQQGIAKQCQLPNRKGPHSMLPAHSAQVTESPSTDACTWPVGHTGRHLVPSAADRGRSGGVGAVIMSSGGWVG